MNVKNYAMNLYMMKTGITYMEKNTRYDKEKFKNSLSKKLET